MASSGSCVGSGWILLLRISPQTIARGRILHIPKYKWQCGKKRTHKPFCTSKKCLKLFIIWRFSEMGVPPNHPFSLVFPYKPSILRYPHLWKPPNIYSNVLVITGSTTWVGYRFPEVVFTARPSLGCHGCHLLVMGSIPHQSLGHHEIAPGFRF